MDEPKSEVAILEDEIEQLERENFVLRKKLSDRIRPASGPLETPDDILSLRIANGRLLERVAGLRSALMLFHGLASIDPAFRAIAKGALDTDDYRANADKRAPTQAKPPPVES